MRIKTIMTACLAVPALSVLCLLSSCSSEELPEKPSTGPQTLTLNLTPAGTRAAVYTDPGTTEENKINSVTIGIFDQTADGTGNYPVKTIQEVPGSLTPSITTSQLVAGDKIRVAVNAKAETFTGAKNLAEFESKTLAIDDALASSDGSATTVTSSNLPMFGTGTVAGTSTTFTASVDVYHMVAKITLKSLSVNFLTTGAYKDATFTPTAIFMSNVPDKLGFYPVDATDLTNYPTFAPAGTLQQGELGTSLNLKAYLGTTTNFGSYSPAHATLSGVNTGTTYNFGDITKNILYLYTMPSSDATASRLVIRGMFDPDGPGENTAAVPVYYPVNINYNSADGSAANLSGGGKAGTAKRIYPNKNYIIDVTIQGKGSKNPTDAIDPEQATAHITVQSFTDASQTNVFN